MEEHKHVLCEPRGSDKMDFEQIIQGFYSFIHSSEEHGEVFVWAIHSVVIHTLCNKNLSTASSAAVGNITRSLCEWFVPLSLMLCVTKDFFLQQHPQQSGP